MIPDVPGHEYFVEEPESCHGDTLMNAPSREPDGQPDRPGNGKPADSPRARRLRALLIEDNRVDARLTQEGLRDCDDGIDCDIAASLREVSAQHLAVMDCAVVDLGLPDASGMQAVDRIHHLAPHIPIVVLTGLADAATGPATLRHGAQDYLVKQHTDGPTIARAIHLAVERKHLETLAPGGSGGDVELLDDLLQRLYAISLGLQITRRRSEQLPEVIDRITQHINDLQPVVKVLRGIITGPQPAADARPVPSQPTPT